MTDSASLWPSDLRFNILPPLKILREQAEALTRISNGLLHATVRRKASDNTILLTMIVESPAKGYAASLIDVSHNECAAYPAELEYELQKHTADDDAALRRHLRKAFASRDIRLVVNSLIAQNYYGDDDSDSDDSTDSQTHT